MCVCVHVCMCVHVCVCVCDEYIPVPQSLPTEHVRQAFVSQDKDNTGTIPALEFVDLMKTIRGFEMSDHVREHLLTVSVGENP